MKKRNVCKCQYQIPFVVKNHPCIGQSYKTIVKKLNVFLPNFGKIKSPWSVHQNDRTIYK